MADEQTEAPDGTAVRVALWRAMHVQVDPPPHVLEDEIGLQLTAPDDGWRRRPDMDPRATSGFRAAIVARARFIEDLVAEQAGHGVGQYVVRPRRRCQSSAGSSACTSEIVQSVMPRYAGSSSRSGA
jgi:O-methyltransferase involved in polyketide biosynthesis